MIETKGQPEVRDTENDQVSVVLFDGHCNLCSRSVQFIIRRDRAGRFRFASLQSEPGSQIVLKFGRNPEDLDTILLYEQDTLFDRSTAVLRIARRLTFPWPLLYAFIVVPAPLRDAVYRWVARNRYRWFGRTDACMLPSAELRARFLSD